MFRFVQSDWVGVRALLSTKLVKESTTYKATSAVTAVSALIFAVTSSAAYASNNVREFDGRDVYISDVGWCYYHCAIMSH